MPREMDITMVTTYLGVKIGERTFRGSGTVWHEVSTGKRPGTEVEKTLSEEWWRRQQPEWGAQVEPVRPGASSGEGSSSRREGTPYSVEELRLASAQPSDEYHRELMRWAAGEIERLTKELEELEGEHERLREEIC